MNIENLMTKLAEIESRIDHPVNEVISSAEQTELTTLYLKLKDLGKDSRYTNYPNIQDLNKEIDRYNSVMADVDKYTTSTVTPGSDKPGMPEVPRQPMPGGKTKPGGDKPLAGNQFAIMKMQKDLKAAGADLGTYGSNKDGVDGNLGGPNSKTRQAMKKYPDIAKKHGFEPSGQSAMTNPNAQAPAVNTTVQQPMNDQAIAGTLYKSMSGLGTDSKLFYSAISQIKSPQQFANVSKLYKAAAGEDLMAAIEGDFSGTDLGNIQRMLSKFQPKKESSELDRIKNLSGI